VQQPTQTSTYYAPTAGAQNQQTAPTNVSGPQQSPVAGQPGYQPQPNQALQQAWYQANAGQADATSATARPQRADAGTDATNFDLTFPAFGDAVTTTGYTVSPQQVTEDSKTYKGKRNQ